MVQIGKTSECDFGFFNNFLGGNVGIGKFVAPFAAFLASRLIGSRLRASEISIMSPESPAEALTTCMD
jgi:hypothetical protein